MLTEGTTPEAEVVSLNREIETVVKPIRPRQPRTAELTWEDVEQALDVAVTNAKRRQFIRTVGSPVLVFNPTSSSFDTEGLVVQVPDLGNRVLVKHQSNGRWVVRWHSVDALKSIPAKDTKLQSAVLPEAPKERGKVLAFARMQHRSADE